MQKTCEAHKIRNAAETLHSTMYTESCFSPFFWQIIQDFLFVDQDAIPCVKGLETIVLMTTVKQHMICLEKLCMSVKTPKQTNHQTNKNPTKNPVSEAQDCVDESVVTAEMQSLLCAHAPMPVLFFTLVLCGTSLASCSKAFLKQVNCACSGFCQCGRQSPRFVQQPLLSWGCLSFPSTLWSTGQHKVVVFDTLIFKSISPHLTLLFLAAFDVSCSKQKKWWHICRTVPLMMKDQQQKFKSTEQRVPLCRCSMKPCRSGTTKIHKEKFRVGLCHLHFLFCFPELLKSSSQDYHQQMLVVLVFTEAAQGIYHSRIRF